MNKIRNIISSLLVALSVLAGFAATTGAANAALIRDYELNGSLADSLGGPSLIADGGTLGATRYSFGANQGLSLTYSALSSLSLYSIELVFDFQQFNIWRKIIDFNARVTDDGFYFDPSNRLDFFPVTSSPTAITSPVDVHVVLTRDATSSIVNAYLNGGLEFSFNDSGGLAVFRGADTLVHFFEDDAVTGFGEASGGSVDCVRIYNTALSAVEVANLASCGPGRNNVPEPSTLLLAAVGLLGLFGSAALRRSGR